MNHRERLEACMAGSFMDRVPVALWRHFPVDDQDPRLLAEATVEFQRNFDFDLVKVSPASSFCLRDWGVQDKWQGSTEGTRTYTKRFIDEPDDWYRLPVLDPNKGHLAEQIECLKLVVKELGQEVPIIQTIFNPLAQAKNPAGSDKLIYHLRMYPDALHTGLRTIMESTNRFTEKLANVGIDGIFYAVQHAQYNLLSIKEYEEFGRLYDIEILKLTSNYWLNMLHLHGENIMFDQFLEYPVSIFNWHDRETAPNLVEGQTLFPGIVCGGLQREHSIVFGSPTTILDEAYDAIRSTDGRRLILGTGCVVPIIAPRGNIATVRESVERYKQ